MNAQQALADAEVTGTAGGGLVKATVNGQGELMDLSIEPAAIGSRRPGGDGADDRRPGARGGPGRLPGGRGPAAAADGAVRRGHAGRRHAGRPQPAGMRARPVRPRLGDPAQPGASGTSPATRTSRSAGRCEGSDVYEGVIQNLIDELGRLPGVGPKGAQRIAFHLLAADHDEVQTARDALLEVTERVRVLPDLRQRGRGGRVPDLPGSAARPVGYLRGGGAQGRRGGGEDPRVPRPLSRARRSDQPDRRSRARTSCGSRS